MTTIDGKKTRKRTVALILGVSICAIAAPLWAHHGTNISYDRSKQWTTEAVVTKFVYANPHPQLFVDFKNEKGETVNWGLELLPNPASLIRNGWSRQRSMEELPAGAKVSVTIAPSKAGGTTGLALKIMNAKGQEVVTAPGTGAPGSAP